MHEYFIYMYFIIQHVFFRRRFINLKVRVMTGKETHTYTHLYTNVGVVRSEEGGMLPAGCRVLSTELSSALLPGTLAGRWNGTGAAEI